MHDTFVNVENGTVFGKASIRAKVAIQMIHSGAAVPTGESTIRLTFSDYIKAVQSKPAGKQKVVKDSSPTAALACVQDEPVYRGERGISPITGSVLVLRKVRGGQFKNWGEKDTFPANRFNPDRIPPPIYPSFAAMKHRKTSAVLHPCG